MEGRKKYKISGSYIICKMICYLKVNDDKLKFTLVNSKELVLKREHNKPIVG